MLNITTSQATTNTNTGPVNGVRQASHLATKKFGLRASRHENRITVVNARNSWIFVK